MHFTDPQAAAEPIMDRLSATQYPLILTHLNPDGDAIGSLLAVWHMLQNRGMQCLAIALPPVPVYCRWLPGAEQIVLYQSGMCLPDSIDLLILVDTATLSRAGMVYDQHRSMFEKLPLLIIDHHITNNGAGTLDLIQPQAASTCELLYDLFVAMGVEITPAIATCLLMGLMTDTQSFQTNSTTSAALHTGAALIDAGANQREIVQTVYHSLQAKSAALLGLGLTTLCFEKNVAWATVTQAMLNTTGADDEAAEEVIRVLQHIGEARAVALFKERRDKSTKISFRSQPPIDVAQFAQRWGGGGHSQAAGATLFCSPDKAITEVIPALQQLVLLKEEL